MSHGIEEAAGWFVSAKLAWGLFIGWLAAVVLYGIYRSLGKAEQDPIRKSGPLVEE